MPPLRKRLRQMAGLAWPLIVAELGWMAMGLVDTLLVGPLGKEAIGAVGVGNILYDTFAICALGLLLGLDPLVAQSFGAGRGEDCNRYLRQGVWLALFLTPPTLLVCAGLPALAAWAGVQPAVQVLAADYLRTVSYGTLPLLLYAAFRRYLQGTSRVRPVMAALVTVNLLNAVADYALIHGAWGFPALGVAGAGWATTVSRLFLAAFLAAETWRRDPLGLWRSWARPRAAELGLLLRLGAPAAGQILIEIAGFGAATLLAGRLSAGDLAAHHIALNLAGLTFMVPLGLSSAGAVAVGQELGRGDPAAARQAGWTAILLAGGFMLGAGGVFALAPAAIIGLFSTETEILATGVNLLRIAAVFQLFDGLQVAATGVLRGAGETRLPLWAHLSGHWAVGLPLGYWLCFPAGYGAEGLWTGLSLGLIAVAVLLMAVWMRRPLEAAA